MILKYNGSASFTTEGTTFAKGEEKVVSQELGARLLATFGSMFKDCTPVEVKTETKPKPKTRAKTKVTED